MSAGGFSRHRLGAARKILAFPRGMARHERAPSSKGTRASAIEWMMPMKEPIRLIWDDRLNEIDKKLVEELNASLDRLNCVRAVEINVSGPFARSKIAWKLATYQHVLLHRIVALMDGTAVAWNNHCTLSAILSARALMETVAVIAEFDERVVRLLGREDLGGLDALAQQGIFASRAPELVT